MQSLEEPGTRLGTPGVEKWTGRHHPYPRSSSGSSGESKVNSMGAGCGTVTVRVVEEEQESAGEGGQGHGGPCWGRHSRSTRESTPGREKEMQRPWSHQQAGLATVCGERAVGTRRGLGDGPSTDPILSEAAQMSANRKQFPPVQKQDNHYVVRPCILWQEYRREIPEPRATLACPGTRQPAFQPRCPAKPGR